MALIDIPPFVPSAPDDLIRSEDINHVQRLARHAVRSHRHTRVLGAPVDDASPQDLAPQITTAEMVDLAVTSAKLGTGAVDAPNLDADAVASASIANNSVSTAKLVDAAVTAPKLAPNAVPRSRLQDGVVSRTKLSMVEVASGTAGIGGLGTIGVPNTTFIQLFGGLAGTLNTIFLPILTVTAASGPASQFAQVEAVMAYRRSQGFSGSGPVVIDLFLRLTNTGQSNCTVNWRVMTFGPFNPVFGLQSGIGGGLI
jgi:hypothetical protein